MNFSIIHDNICSFIHIYLLQHGRSTCEVVDLLGISQSMCSRISWECDAHVFQLDSDPKHLAKLFTQWLWMQNFDVLKWPLQSLDSNPMEHLWALVEQKLNEYPILAKGMLRLWGACASFFPFHHSRSMSKNSITSWPIVSKLFKFLKEGGHIFLIYKQMHVTILSQYV